MTDPAIEVLHVGSASRDLTEADPRGWRLGGGVTYAALTTARLGLRTAAVLGADAEAASADELDLLRTAGVALRIVPLDESPVFRNLERAGGRVQVCMAPGRPLPVVELPSDWSTAVAWSVVPVAGEVVEASAAAVPPDVLLVLGWQGWLRELTPGNEVQRRPPAASAWLRRADLVGVSRHDLPTGMQPEDVRGWLRRDAALLVTEGDRGGRLVWPTTADSARTWSYAAVPPEDDLDPTGAGDVFLAALTASLVRPALIGVTGRDVPASLGFAAAAASLAIERPGLLGVPDVASVAARVPPADLPTTG